MTPRHPLTPSPSAQALPASRARTPLGTCAAVWALGLAALLAGCGDAEVVTPPAAPAPKTTAVIGPDGGTITGPDGVQIVVPAGALAEPLTLAITRTESGAPDGRPDDVQGTPTYEFTPHDVVFRKPVSIRLPVPASATAAEVFVAPLGGAWESQFATIEGGVAEIARNTLSFGFVGYACAPTNRPPFSASNPDPYPCSTLRGGANATAQPAAALTVVSPPRHGDGVGSAGTFRVTRPATLRLALNFTGPADCANASVRLIRRNPSAPISATNPQVLFDGGIATAVQTVPPPIGAILTGSAPILRMVGTHTVDLPFTEADNAINATGTHLFVYSVRCQRPTGRVLQGADAIIVESAVVPVPPVTVGGTVGGLTGAGLVLQNNGANDLAVAGNGAFTFAAPVPAGSAYAVTVKTQPTGQTCSVGDGTGTATANVANVTVTCASSAAPSWSAPVAVSAVGGNVGAPSAGSAADGSTLVTWSQFGGQSNIWASRWDGSAWGAPELTETLDGGAFGGGYEPSIAVGTGGAAAIGFGFETRVNNGFSPSLYRGGLARYGSAWQSESVMSNGDAPALAASRDGTRAMTLFREQGVSSKLLGLGSAASTDLVVDGSAGSTPYVSVAPLGTSDFVAAWVAGGAVRASTFVGNAWGTNATLNAPGSGPYPPAVAGSSGGTAIAVWTMLASDYEVYASRFAGGAWSTPNRIAPQAGENIVEQGRFDLRAAATAVDAAGNAYVAWIQRDASNQRIVRARRCPAGLPLSACEPAIDIDAQAQRPGTPSMIVSPTGEVWAAWYAEVGNDIVVRVARGGATGWSAPVTVGLAYGDRLPPSLAVDGAGRVTVAWVQREGQNTRVFVSRTQ